MKNQKNVSHKSEYLKRTKFRGSNPYHQLLIIYKWINATPIYFLHCNMKLQRPLTAVFRCFDWKGVKGVKLDLDTRDKQFVFIEGFGYNNHWLFLHIAICFWNIPFYYEHFNCNRFLRYFPLCQFRTYWTILTI